MVLPTKNKYYAQYHTIINTHYNGNITAYQDSTSKDFNTTPSRASQKYMLQLLILKSRYKLRPSSVECQVWTKEKLTNRHKSKKVGNKR